MKLTIQQRELLTKAFDLLEGCATHCRELLEQEDTTAEFIDSHLVTLEKVTQATRESLNLAEGASALLERIVAVSTSGGKVH